MIRDTHSRSFVGRAWFVPLVFLALGCGGYGDVSGTATFNGKPVSCGSVVILAADSMTYTGDLDENGQYQIKDVARGNARVAISSPNPAALAKLAAPMARPKAKSKDTSNRFKGAPLPTIPQTWIPLPKRYADFEKSDLRLTVKSGDNTFDIAVVAAPAKK